MLGKTYDLQVCSAARALEWVGERWTLLIVRDALFAGATRFSDFHKGLGIATNILTSRLDGLVEAGIMERRGYAQNPELHEYLLTDKGRELAPVIVALSEWGDRWAAPRWTHPSFTPTPPVAAKSPSNSTAPSAAKCTTRRGLREYDRGRACPPVAQPNEQCGESLARRG